jgi:hypothetical protein
MQTAAPLDFPEAKQIREPNKASWSFLQIMSTEKGKC